MTRGRMVALAVVLFMLALIAFVVYMNASPSLAGDTGNVPDKLIERNTVTEVDGKTVDLPAVWQQG